MKNYIVINRDAPESPGAIFPIQAANEKDAAMEWVNQAYVDCAPSVPVDIRLCVIPEDAISYYTFTVKPVGGPQFEVKEA